MLNWDKNCMMKGIVKSIIVENNTEMILNRTLLKRYYLFKELTSFAVFFLE